MTITDQLTDEAVLGELGRRIARIRLERNMSQAELGEEAGVGLATVQRLEGGMPTKSTSLVRVLRALGGLSGIELLVPEPVPSPIERLKLMGKERQRARHSRPAHREAIDPEPWVWGDERDSDD